MPEVSFMLYGHTEEGCDQQHTRRGQRTTLAVYFCLPHGLRHDLAAIHCSLSQAAVLEPLDSPVSTSSCYRRNAGTALFKVLGFMWHLGI